MGLEDCGIGSGLKARFRTYERLLTNAWKPSDVAGFEPADVMLFCGDDDRGITVAGRAYSPIVDSLNERLMEAGLRTLTVAAPFASETGHAAFGRVVEANGILARADIAQRAMRSRSWKQLNRNPLVRAWGRIIARVAPRIIIGIQPPRELCVAANLAGVPIADLQHGVLSDEGYYGVGYRSAFNQQGWPDEILCWDEASAEWARSNVGERARARVIGNPWLLRFLFPRATDRTLESMRSRLPDAGGRPKLLVTLQWGFAGNNEYDENGIPTALAEFIDSSGAKYTWWLRIHPMEMKGPRRGAAFTRMERAFGQRQNISWDACSTVPLPLILREADLHLTSHSAVTMEAALFGKKTALLDSRKELMREWFGEQIRQGAATLVDADAHAIESWIEANLGAPGPASLTAASAAALDAFVAEIAGAANG